MIRAAAFVAAVSAALAGCTTTSGSAPQVSRSGFDGARVVSIQAHGLACRDMLCPGLGAEWNSRRPDMAVLSVHLFNAYAPITGAELSIGGRPAVRLHDPIMPTGLSYSGGMRQSSQAFAVPMALVREIAASDRAWLRVLTTSGAVEEAIVDGGTDSKALHALRRFVGQVDEK